MAVTVILIGFMGAGKTAVGKKLSNELGFSFMDADFAVEKEMGMTIAEAFEQKGEGGFRKAEAAVTLKLLDEAATVRGGSVISLGGGAVTIEPVFERLKREPLVIFLDEDADAAFSRAHNGARPLAANRQKFRLLFYERKNLYQGAARFIVDTRGKGIDEVVAEIQGLLKQRADPG